MFLWINFNAWVRATLELFASLGGNYDKTIFRVHFRVNVLLDAIKYFFVCFRHLVSDLRAGRFRKIVGKTAGELQASRS
jgi:hypothetical protein